MCFIPMMECGFGTENCLVCLGIRSLLCTVPVMPRVFFHPVHVYALCIMHVQCKCLKFVYFINFSNFLFPVRGSCFGLRTLSALLSCVCVSVCVVCSVHVVCRTRMLV